MGLPRTTLDRSRSGYTGQTAEQQAAMEAETARQHRERERSMTVKDTYTKAAVPIVAELRTLATYLDPASEAFGVRPATYVTRRQGELRYQLRMLDATTAAKAAEALAIAGAKAQRLIAIGDAKLLEAGRAANLAEARMIVDTLPEPKRLAAKNLLPDQIKTALANGQVERAKEVLLRAMALAGAGADGLLEKAVDERMNLLPHRQAALAELAGANEDHRAYTQAHLEAQRDAQMALGNRAASASASAAAKMAAAYAPGGAFGGPAPEVEA